MEDWTIYLILAPILAGLGTVLTVFLIWTLLHRHRSPTSTFAWMMAIILIPYAGIPMYLLFGGRKIVRFVKEKKLPPTDTDKPDDVSRDSELFMLPGVSGVYPTTTCEDIELFIDGHAAFAEIVDLIKNAREQIDICTYILGSEETGLAIIHALTDAAKRGVKVRFLIDSYGSMKLSSRFVAPLKDAGGEVSFFLPIMRLPFQRRVNLRNHRKILLIDDTIAVIGGMNLTTQYMGNVQDASYWVDLSIRIKGEGVRYLREVFESDWAFSERRPQPEPPDVPVPDIGTCPIRTQFIASGPDVVGDPIHDAILIALFAAKKRIWIVSPYILPDESLLKAMIIAVHRGIDVRLITPQDSNHPIADFAREGYLQELQKVGARIFFYTPGMLHGKAMIVDDNLSFVGSANMDMRSMFFNFEIAAGIESETFCAQLDEWMKTLLQDSVEGVREKNRFEQAWYGIGRLVAPVL